MNADLRRSWLAEPSGSACCEANPRPWKFVPDPTFARIRPDHLCEAKPTRVTDLSGLHAFVNLQSLELDAARGPVDLAALKGMSVPSFALRRNSSIRASRSGSARRLRRAEADSGVRASVNGSSNRSK